MTSIRDHSVHLDSLCQSMSRKEMVSLIFCTLSVFGNYSAPFTFFHMAHLYLGRFYHSSLQILSSSVRLDGERHCTAIFRSLQRCSFRSGLWPGHSRTFRDSCVVLAVCLGLLSCWKVNLAQVWGPDHSGAGFHQGSLCTLLCSSFPRSWLGLFWLQHDFICVIS